MGGSAALRRATSDKGTEMNQGTTRISFLGVFLLSAVLALEMGCATHQRYRSFTTSTPLPPNHYLILGFMAGREAWDNDRRPVRKMALRLRALNLPGVHLETIENTRRDLAIQLVCNALDRNGDGKLDAQELGAARVILYGHSFGGAAVVKLARQLQQMGVPVLLTVQVDSVGIDDQVIPPNVARAANFYQRNGLLIRGQPAIRAEDPQKTLIVGNFKYDYAHKDVDRSGAPAYENIFAVAHAKIASDPEVWAKVQELIVSEVK